MENIRDSLKQFIDSRLQEAIRSQALCPSNLYVASGLVRKLDPGQIEQLSEASGNKLLCSKTDFKW
ncbi:hypothetical protein [Methanolobus profundi]|uniref:hypothetical protein n=1 Tax=Methanolobus profundi TaxID=487685 RepID=UPI000B858A64|nr:hypothetical protein [Methanolobus profundi]